MSIGPPRIFSPAGPKVMEFDQADWLWGAR